LRFNREDLSVFIISGLARVDKILHRAKLLSPKRREEGNLESSLLILSPNYSKLRGKKIGEELYFERAPPHFFDGRHLPSPIRSDALSLLAVWDPLCSNRI
jgi:hypothetical protein